MSDPICARCERPMRHDQAVVCSQCGHLLRRDLDEARRIAGDINLTVARLAHVVRFGQSIQDEGDDGWYAGDNALEPTPLPVHLYAAERHDAAVGELSTWARHIAEERGEQIPVWRPCEHEVCISRLTRAHIRLPGPLCEAAVTRTRPHPLDRLCTYLGERVEWLRHRPEADEAWTAIAAACHAVVSVIDRHDIGELVGLCPCGTWLYGVTGADTVTCRRCGTGYLVAASRAQMAEDLRDRAVTASEAARAAVYLGVIPDAGRLRKLVWDWCDRGHLVPVDEDPRYKGPPRYLLGHVLDRLMRTVAAKAA